MSEVPSAKLVLLKDLCQCQLGDSVRITGTWSSYNESTKIAVLQYKNAKAEIDTTHTQNSLPLRGEVIQCIGEITHKSSDDNTARIRARIIRSVNTMDMELYERVVELRNKVI